MTAPRHSLSDREEPNFFGKRTMVSMIIKIMSQNGINNFLALKGLT
jgi:hypothetical protein